VNLIERQTEVPGSQLQEDQQKEPPNPGPRNKEQENSHPTEWELAKGLPKHKIKEGEGEEPKAELSDSKGRTPAPYS